MSYSVEVRSDAANIGSVMERMREWLDARRIEPDVFRHTADEAGVTDDDMYTPQWKLWEARGKANAQTGYEKDPAAWCENMWRFLGPEHPAMINHALLGK